MSIIDITLIKSIYSECLDNAQRVCPPSSWSITPTGVQVLKLQARYAEISHDGLITINQAFIGTESVSKLKETVFHELAHCIVGLEANHNKHFRYVFGILADGLTVLDDDIATIKNNNGYPLRLVAYGSNKVIDMGGAFRRSKKFLNYKPVGNAYLSVQGVRIERFAYLPYGDDWKTINK